jgi:hypothetical protein
MSTRTTRSNKRQIDAVEGAVVEAPSAPSVPTQVNFVSEIEQYDWKVNEREVRSVFASSLYSGIKNQFHCITQNFLYGLTEGSIDSSPYGGVIFVIYYREEFPCLIPEAPDAQYIYKSDTEIFNLFWGAMQNVGSNSLVERGEGKREQDFANIKQGSSDGWNICFLNTMSVWIDVPGGTYLQLIPKQPAAVAPAGGRPKKIKKQTKNQKLRKRTTKRKSKRTRKSRKH